MGHCKLTLKKIIDYTRSFLPAGKPSLGNHKRCDLLPVGTFFYARGQSRRQPLTRDA